MCSAVGIAVGSVVSGAVSQRKIVSTYVQMGAGAVMVGIGILFTFPPSSIKLLYDNAPYVGYPAVFLASFGDPMVTIPALRAMLDMQVQIKGRITPEQTTFITCTWSVGYMAFYYSGSFISGWFLDCVSFSVGAMILSVACGISMMISCILNCSIATKDDDKDYIPLATGA